MGRAPTPGESQRGVAFRRQMRELAHKLAIEQGMTVKAPSLFVAPDLTKRHSCKTASGPCAECEYEVRVKERLTTLLGEPVSRNG